MAASRGQALARRFVAEPRPQVSHTEGQRAEPRPQAAPQCGGPRASALARWRALAMRIVTKPRSQSGPGRVLFGHRLRGRRKVWPPCSSERVFSDEWQTVGSGGDPPRPLSAPVVLILFINIGFRCMVGNPTVADNASITPSELIHTHTHHQSQSSRLADRSGGSSDELPDI